MKDTQRKDKLVCNAKENIRKIGEWNVSIQYMYHQQLHDVC